MFCDTSKVPLIEDYFTDVQTHLIYQSDFQIQIGLVPALDESQ